MNKWSPRAGRNAHYMQFEEYLRRVARIMGIKYDDIGQTPAPTSTFRTGVATRNTHHTSGGGGGENVSTRYV